MKKLLLVFSVFALVLGSCSKSDPAVVPPVAVAGVLVTKIINTKNGVSVTTNYTYNGNKLIKSVSSDGKSTEVTYNNDLVVKREDFNGTVLYERNTYTYNSNNKLASYINIRYTGTTNTGTKHDYIYNTDGTISFTLYQGNEAGQTSQQNTGKAFLTNGQITKVESYYASPTGKYTSDFTYDAKLNPFYNITGFDKLILVGSTAGDNLQNLLTESDYDELYIRTSFVSTYTYNSLNYPITKNKTITYNTNGVPSSTSTSSLQYFY